MSEIVTVLFENTGILVDFLCSFQEQYCGFFFSVNREIPNKLHTSTPEFNLFYLDDLASDVLPYGWDLYL